MFRRKQEEWDYGSRTEFVQPFHNLGEERRMSDTNQDRSLDESHGEETKKTNNTSNIEITILELNLTRGREEKLDQHIAQSFILAEIAC